MQKNRNSWIMNEGSGKKIKIYTNGGPVIAGGSFTNVEFVAQKYVYNNSSSYTPLQEQAQAAEEQAEVEVADVNGTDSDVPPTASPSGARPSPVVPPQLDTDEARQLLSRLSDAALLDGAWQPVGLSNAEKGVLAWLLARRLKISNVWQTFAALWGMKVETLRTAYNRGMEQRRTGAFMERVKQVMGNS